MSSYEAAVSLLAERGIPEKQGRAYVGEMARRIVAELCERFADESEVGLGLLVTWLRGVSTEGHARVPAVLVPQNEWEKHCADYAKEIAALSEFDPRTVVGLAFVLQWKSGRRPSIIEMREEHARRMAA